MCIRDRLPHTARSAQTGPVVWHAMPGSPGASAHDPFAVLREFDALGLRLIWVETPPDKPDSAGVCDRLQRAPA